MEGVFGTSLSTTVAGSGTVSLAPPGGLYPYGTIVRVTAMPYESNYFVLWGSAASGQANPLDFPVRTPNPVISSLFSLLPTNRFTLTVTEDGFGKAFAHPESTTYTNGQSVTVLAIPNARQEFLGWTGDEIGNENPLQVVMSQSKVITANFTTLPTLLPPEYLGPVNEEGFWFTLQGEYGRSYQIDASSNVVEWMPLGVVTNTFGTSQFNDLEGTNLLQRFYRAVILP